MTKPTISQSQKRFQESISSLFSQTHGHSSQFCLFIKSSTDIGVVRNGGRNGARFAPQSFLATFKKFAINDSIKKYQFQEIEVANESEEKTDFHSAQLLEAKRISEALKGKSNVRIIHLGGGHDHVYPLLKSMSEDYSKLIVINIDAHADTRTDENFHSGTPFRQFSKDFTGNFHLFQIGLHPFANSSSTLETLEQGDTHILWKNELNPQSLNAFFDKIKKVTDAKTLIVFSLDSDALNGPEVPGVSAVNPSGLSRDEIKMIWDQYVKLPLCHLPVMGIYELNPLYDTLASLSMRTLGSFVYETL